jgi:hypothetical protein
MKYVTGIMQRRYCKSHVSLPFLSFFWFCFFGQTPEFLTVNTFSMYTFGEIRATHTPASDMNANMEHPKGNTRRGTEGDPAERYQEEED